MRTAAMLACLLVAALALPSVAGAQKFPDQSRFQKVTLNDHPGEPMSLAVLPDGRVLHTARTGEVRIHNPRNGLNTLVADMRELPVLGAFDHVTCLDDALNYVLHGDELHDTLAGFAHQLEPGGLAVWDVNTLSLVRSSFTDDWVAERGEWFFCWRGTAAPAVAAGAVVEARVDAFRRRGSTWTRTTSRHRQRHWPSRELLRTAEAVGLEVLEVLGQRRCAELEPEIDEDRHIKAVFIARRSH